MTKPLFSPKPLLQINQPATSLPLPCLQKEQNYLSQIDYRDGKTVFVLFPLPSACNSGALQCKPPHLCDNYCGFTNMRGRPQLTSQRIMLK